MADGQQRDKDDAGDPDRPLDEPPPSSVSWVSFAILLAVLSFGMYYYQRYRARQRKPHIWQPEPVQEEQRDTLPDTSGSLTPTHDDD